MPRQHVAESACDREGATISTARTSLRTLAGVVLTWAGLTALLALLLPGTSSAQPVEGDEDVVQLGGELFQNNCAACHGPTGEGGPGTAGDLTLGPAVNDIDINYADMTMRTGRMPIASREAGVYIEELDDDQREAIVAWMSERLGLPGEIYEVADGDPGRGQELYTRNCVACHGAGGAGGVSGAGVTVPDISGLEPEASFQATRVGPFQMPPFSEQVLDDQQVSDIAAYVEGTDDAPSTLLGIHEVDETTAALFAAALTLGAGAVLLVTDRARRVSRLGGPSLAPGLPRDVTPDDEVEP